MVYDFCQAEKILHLNEFGKTFKQQEAVFTNLKTEIQWNMFTATAVSQFIREEFINLKMF